MIIDIRHCSYEAATNCLIYDTNSQQFMKTVKNSSGVFVQGQTKNVWFGHMPESQNVVNHINGDEIKRLVLKSTEKFESKTKYQSECLLIIRNI